MFVRRLMTTLALFLMSVPAMSVWAVTCPAGNDLVTPNADLVDNGDFTVTHVKTGLMWKKCSEGLSGVGCATGTASTFTWAQALNVAVAANLGYFAGYSDWRLPSKSEMESIVETGCYSPSINATRFPNFPGYIFWASTSYSPDPTQAWSHYFSYGDSAANPKTSPFNVQLVRGGLSLGAFDSLASGCTLDVDGNGSIDALTDGLIVLRAMFGLTGNSVTNAAIGANATRSTWGAIQPYLNANCGTSFLP